MQDEHIKPPAVCRDTKSIEMPRVWIAEGGIHVSLNIGIWNNPESECTEAAS
jgi:hypothetical protein